MFDNPAIFCSAQSKAHRHELNEVLAIFFLQKLKKKFWKFCSEILPPVTTI